MDEIIIVVKGGMVQNVFGPCPNKFDIEVIDLDLDGAESAVIEAAEERLRTVEQFLCKIY